MTDPRIEQSTLDCWRIGGLCSGFLLCLTFSALVFSYEDSEAIRRCEAKSADPASCHLIVYGR